MNIEELKAAMALHRSPNPNEPDGTPFDWVFLAMAEARAGGNDKLIWLLNTQQRMQRVESDPLFEDPTWTWTWPRASASGWSDITARAKAH